ncbi:hypothetical protein [Neobacillus terrae]|uniref:hypothetical protein n=1 Tax=Neobacillus terrae TaxID=3034837 RepID=UPI001409BECE|nr:hypothetical protein [Neobacillus terrae]NHM31035.1 hypothetical protein [Neobacillus terrae]
MKSSSARLSLFGLLLILCVYAYLDSPYSFLNKPFLYTKTELAMSVMKNNREPSQVPVFEEKLESRKEIGGYIVETYREYEVYKDKDGNILKSTPTSKTDTLKYKDYDSIKGR